MRTMGKTKLLSAILAFSFLLITGPATSALAMDVTLAWGANTEADLAGYKIYYDTDSGQPYQGTGAENGSSPSPIDVSLAEDEDSDPVVVQYTVRNLPDGTYYFVVTAHNTEGLESGYSNEVSAGGSTPPPPPPANAAPVLSNLQVNAQAGSTTIYTNDPSRQVDVRIVASDNTLVSQYLILDGDNDPNGEIFFAIPGGARQNPIFTVTDFVLNNTDGNHTVYAWVKDDQGLISATATKTNVILDRVAPTVAISYSVSNPFKAGDTITIMANFTDVNPISGTPTISINYAGTGSDIAGAVMSQVSNKQWRYVMTVPSGNEGTATVTVAASDAAGNAVGTPTGNTFVVDSSSPSVVGYPVINYTGSTVTVTYSESNMRNATVASNYSFNNGLLLSGNGADTSGTGKIFRFPLNAGTLQHNIIYTMQISSAVTDSAGKVVTPNTARVNDDDNDGMADDWEKQWFGSISVKSGSADTDGDLLTDGAEYSYARSNPAWGTDRWTLSPLSQDSDGDGIPDSYEVLNGLNPVSSSDRDLDSDNDGWSNYEEFLYGTSANDPNSCPQAMAAIEVVEVIPLDNSGIPPSKERLPNNTAFAVRMESVNGIDMTDPNAVTFSVNDGSNTYTRKLNDLNGTGAKVVRAIPLVADGNLAYSLWAVYYRSSETSIANSYSYDSVVEVGVSAKDVDGQSMEPLSFRFRIEGQDEESAAQGNIPETATSIAQSGSTKTVSVVSGPLAGASIVYASTMLQQIGIEPYFGPIQEIPPLTTAEAVGIPLNLLPPAVFPEGVTIVIPCPGVSDPTSLAIYYYDGENWVPACDSAGNVLPEGEGWMVRGSRINHNYDAETGTPAQIEIQVYHFSAAVAADTPTVSAVAEAEGGSSCFISALGGK
jgi:hypothetical protein